MRSSERLVVYGFAVIEAALALLVLMPLCLLGVGVWDYMSSVSEISGLVEDQLSQVQTRSVVLRNGENDIRAELNEAALRAALDKLVRDTEQKLQTERHALYTQYRIEAVVVDRSPSSGVVGLGYRILYTRSAGGLAADSVFGSATKVSATSEGEQVPRDISVLGDKIAAIGLALTIKPRGDILATLLGEGSGLGVIAASKMADLRGDYVWQ